MDANKVRGIREAWCAIDGARGIYCPQAFVEGWGAVIADVDMENVDIVRNGPDHPDYWEAWTEITDNATLRWDDGTKATIHQDSDVFIVPDGMVWSDSEDWWTDPDAYTVISYGYEKHESQMSSAEVAAWVRQIRDNGRRGDDGCGNAVEYTRRATFEHVDGGIGIEHIIRYKNGTGHTLKIGLSSRTLTHYMTS